MTSAPNFRAAPRVIDDDAIARAEAALRSLASQFSGWLKEELDKLDAARWALPDTSLLTRADVGSLYTHAHDLKGLGTTYGFALISRIAASLCSLLEAAGNVDAAMLKLIDSHIEAIHAIVRDDLRDEEDPRGIKLAEALESNTQGVMTA